MKADSRSLSLALTPEAGILDNFCYALHNMESLPERPKELKEEIFKLLFDSAETSSFAVNEQKNYEQDMTTERDLRNQLAYAKKEGREEGIAEGATSIAKVMLSKGYSVTEVSECCGLSVDEVKSLMK